MKLEIHPRVVANFFIDGAKIVFGSLVVGAFIPTTGGAGFPLTTFIGGAIAAAGFFIVASIAAHKEDRLTNQ